MIGVLAGFAIIGFVILVGAVLGKTAVLGEHAPYVLSRLVFFVLTPCLLFTVLAAAPVETLLSERLVISALAAIACFTIFAIVARFVFRRSIADTAVGALASGYVNANNIGIPVSLYVLGDVSYSAPVILVQLLLFSPIVLAILDASTKGAVSIGRVALVTVRNPLIIASMLGAAVAVSGVTVPEVVLAPFALVGAAAVPVVLITFGMSLTSSRLLEPGSARRDVVLATSLKVVVMPIVAYLLAHFVFGLNGFELFALVVLAALPSAQNVFNYAQRYDRGVIVARDTVLLTTILCVPALVVITALLAPG